MATEARDYTEQDLEASLRRLFVDDGGADFIGFDEHALRNRFLSEALQYGLDNGWLYGGETVGDEQWTQIRYGLSEQGKEHFGVPQ